MSKHITLTKYQGTNKEGKTFTCFKLHAGLYTTLIFPKPGLETNYLNKFVDDEARSDFAGDDLDEYLDDHSED